jgi:hypothetical protein
MSLAELPELVGFFSYSREDDSGAAGRLTKLRERIHEELRSQLGRRRSNFRLWQDKAAIAEGALWDNEIRAAVAQSVFFVPIITPTTLKSEHCKTEFDLFLAREQELGRNDLVFPILYIRVPELEDETGWRDHPVLSIVGRRQYLDWRAFRHLDADAREVGVAIERFCQSIHDALNRPWLAPEARRRRDEEQARRAKELEDAQRQNEQENARRQKEEDARQRAEEVRRREELEQERRLKEERRQSAATQAQRHASTQRQAAAAEPGLAANPARGAVSIPEPAPNRLSSLEGKQERNEVPESQQSGRGNFVVPLAVFVVGAFIFVPIGFGRNPSNAAQVLGILGLTVTCLVSLFIGPLLRKLLAKREGS